MDLSKLPKITKKSAKRVGRGIGSGKGGHTSGRGQKGQKSREKVAVGFEGTKTKKSLLKRLPLLRGRGKFKPLTAKLPVINLEDLAEWPEKTPVNSANLTKAGIKAGKILGQGEVKKALIIEMPISAPAAKKVIKAGGKIGKD
ncbi:MAG: 50S ribosomal protein L15 [Candidatus Amesbacteria bacterium GW2011_GWB1_47_19]|nr:MAG: 50S ribosomal protein L15 [Candidatus Amesbacteria bacterium GW2011_GWA1_44_24]KKU32043.1 MAG: 50S ribosomal protein L15, large subunit ribosomal protein L15 [Candidatus Amesbacteria bacterium GW2011_GWC1_46_24]KKU67727.1 MAG: 50S ribosomal protein L15 [Candidatus Amesbacteria bacterium GW2011_GWB1_47_19]OGD06088.1 MAG: 50S ribosomal protein L15 [Candidatus Amesbacteria bacterium RIFOXYB1_FULL_47_13]HBC72321.1 50S ribosomal protein L15 [Candidatus Amesbacteria bacterium]